MHEVEARQLWTACTVPVKAQVSEATWKAWMDAIEPVDLDGDTLVLAVPSALARERIEHRYTGLLLDTLADIAGARLRVRFDVHPKHDWDEHPANEPDPSADGVSSQHWTSTTALAQPDPDSPEASLDRRYTFDDFVIGQSNRFAHAAAMSVAEAPARSYNPLFIHGDAGLGKTHLLHAIGNYVRQNFPSRHVRYVSTETFMNEFVEAIRTNGQAHFKRRYREADVLLVDDIQFLQNKESLQEEFFHTFNSLYGAARQIVLTSDRPPKSIATLEDRLRSRFLSGLITDIQPPDLETRLAILRSKSRSQQAYVPDDVLEFIATHVQDNIRELEGALIRINAFANLNHAPLELDLAKRVLSDLVSSQSRRITPEMILQKTAEAFGFSIDDLIGTSRRRPLVTARQIGMYVCRELTDYSYPAIGREFGNRDHTTVIHAVDKIAALMGERRQIYDQVNDILHRVRDSG